MKHWLNKIQNNKEKDKPKRVLRMTEESRTKQYYEGFDLSQLLSGQDIYGYLHDEYFCEVLGEKENLIDIDVGRKTTLEKVMSKRNHYGLHGISLDA